jgi:alpha-D-ribose 1-methylphosphonate 5-triphosphate synthase subunit PhnH
MNADALATLGAGFSHEAHGSQRVFRAALQALSHPGRPVTVEHDAEVPSVGHAASAAVLLALLDADCKLWLSPTLRDSDAAAWLRFHTGCRLVDRPAQAHFAWLAASDALQPLDSFSLGSDSYPDQSTTCVIDVAALHAVPAATAPWRLSGPGIQDAAGLQVQGLDRSFVAQWQANHGLFPRGVDVLLATGPQIVGLPRTTRIEQQKEA